MAIPKVSVVIPVYNTEKYLRQCVESLTGQTLSEIEIIIVDDGSKEECAALCDNLAKADSRIKVIHKSNEGQGIARNCGIKASSGEYIGFVDSDDYVDVKMYENLFSVAEKYDADIVMSGISFVGGNTFAKSGEHVEKNYFDKETVFEDEDVKQVVLGVVGADVTNRQPQALLVVPIVAATLDDHSKGHVGWVVQILQACAEAVPE